MLPLPECCWHCSYIRRKLLNSFLTRNVSFLQEGRWIKHTELTAELLKLGMFSCCHHWYCAASKVCKELIENAAV